TDVPLLDQIDQRDTPVLVLLRDADHEPKIRADQLLDRLLVTRKRTMAQLDLLLGRDQLMLAHVTKVLLDRDLLLARTQDTVRQLRRCTATLPLLPSFRRGGHQTCLTSIPPARSANREHASTDDRGSDCKDSADKRARRPLTLDGRLAPANLLTPKPTPGFLASRAVPRAPHRSGCRPRDSL